MITTRVKKAFTLVELVLVVILLFATMYFFVFSSSTFKVKNQENKFSFVNIKEKLKEVDFKNRVSFVCIENNFDCFIKVDGDVIQESKIERVFTTKPEVYEYNTDQIIVDFQSIRIDDIDYDVVFELELNSDFKFVEELILDTLDDRVFVYNSIYETAKFYDSLGEAFDVFEKNKLEVKDAF